MNDDTLETLVGEAIAGDRIATTRLLMHYGAPLLERLTARMRHNRFPEITAEDVLQEVYVDVFKGIATFKPDMGVPFVGWLNRVADNRLARTLRDRGRVKRGGNAWRVEGPQSSGMRLMNDINDEHAGTPSGECAADEARQAIELCVAALPEHQREAIEQYYLQQGDLGEIAQAMDTTKEALRGLLYRARKTMRGMMGSSSIWFNRK